MGGKIEFTTVVIFEWGLTEMCNNARENFAERLEFDGRGIPDEGSSMIL
jgi:hypothetical protein